MLDCEIRPILRQKLERRFENEPDTVFVEEFVICDQATRIDLAVINGHLHGYEIKGSSDRLDRLVTQVPLYSKAMEYCTLVADRKHIKQALNILPLWWGILEARSDNERHRLLDVRRAKRNPAIDPQGVCSFLWAKELRSLIQSEGLHQAGSKWCAASMRFHLASNVPLRRLITHAKTVLKARGDWRLQRQQTLCDDSQPPLSTALDSQAILDWLLSVGSPDRQR